MSTTSLLSSEEQQRILRRMQGIPIFETLRFDLVRLQYGVFESVVPHDAKYDGIFECFHGGILMTIADSAAAMAALTVCGAFSKITTTDMNIRFLAPVYSDVKIVARVIKPGRTLIPISADLIDANGALAAVAQVTYMVLKPSARIDPD